MHLERIFPVSKHININCGNGFFNGAATIQNNYIFVQLINIII